MPGRPNIVVIMTDQQRADLCAREGYPLDTTPFLDSLADSGADFRKAYTSTPVCAPARVSLFTGRYPSATRVRVNFNTSDATYEADLLHVLKHLGYKTALCGKNHSHIAVERFDFCERFSHGGGSSPDRTDEEKAFDDFLSGLNHHTCLEPTPFPIERQGPHRMVSKAQHWIEGLDGKPFFLWMSFPEPHNPFQVPEPYFSMFAPERLPRPQTGRADLDRKGFRWKWLRETWSRSLPDYEKQLDRARANYHGMLRLIDDQIRRFVEFLEDKNLRDNTVIVFLTDHGDFVGEYDLIRKGPDLPEVLVRMPLLISGPRINSGNRVTEAHVSICDIMPTLCDMLGVPIPAGVQGRSLWPVLSGGDYPAAEFRSAYAEQGFGGLPYNGTENLTPEEEGALTSRGAMDCLNSWTQSGTMRMVRKDDWKLVFNASGKGELYNLADDPRETENLYYRNNLASVRENMHRELLTWMLRVQDPLPLPRDRYIIKTHPRNYRETE